MPTVHDIAAYILQQRGPMSAMKLQKLVYYCQAWSLVWDDRALFPEKIRAWANGPVVRELYDAHKGSFSVGPDWPAGAVAALDSKAKVTIDAVLRFYGDQSSDWLSQLTHQESPWQDARRGLLPGQRGNAEIPISAMAEYYGSLV